MEKAFWEERWARHDIGFNQPRAHDLLVRHWPSLPIPKQQEVFVPLCGKSQDMVWLAEQGYNIFGVELSPIAVNEFFAEQKLEPAIAQRGLFKVFSGGPYRILCGDLFDLDTVDLKSVTAVYDRAALIALPENMRRRYADKLKSILPTPAPIFLIGIDYPPGEIDGPPFSVPSKSAQTLFDDAFDVSVIESRDGLAASDNLKKRGVTRLEENAYLLSRRS